MSAAVRFAFTEQELNTIVRSTPGLVLPSFVAGTAETSPPTADAPKGSCDPRALLALALQMVADGLIQTVSWSPGEVVQRSIALSGGVAASVCLRSPVDDAGARVSSTVEVALLPTIDVASELASSMPAVGDGPPGPSDAREVGVIASRAIVEAARYADPALVEAAADELWVDRETAALLHGLRGRQSSGLRVRCFDGRSGRCIGGDDWFGSDEGWRRLRLRVPPSETSVPTLQRLVDDATVSVAVATDEGIRRSLMWLTAALLRVIAR